MRHIWPFAALSLVTVVACAADPDPADDLEDPPADPGGSGSVGGGDSASAFGCDAGVGFDGGAHRLARGGKLDLVLHDLALFPKPRTVSSSAPEILAVAATPTGVQIAGVAPGTAEVVVSRCGRRVGGYQVTVAQVADVEVRLSYGLTGGSEPLGALAGIAGSIDQLEVTYYDDQGVALPGRGAASFAFEGGVHRSAPITLGLVDGFDGVPRETLPIGIDGPGRLIATTDALEVAVDVAVAPAPARLELRLVEREILGLQVHALVATGETADGAPIAGLAPTFTITPAEAFRRIETTPASSQLFLLGDPHGPVTFIAEVAGVSATRTVTFP